MTILANSWERIGEYIPPSLAVDGVINTFWHMDWDNTNSVSHWFLAADLGKEAETEVIRYIGRPNSATGGNHGIIQSANILTGTRLGNFSVNTQLTTNGDNGDDRVPVEKEKAARY